MSLSTDAKFWHSEYQRADKLVRNTVDRAFTAARGAIASTGMDTANDDRAEELIAAIMKYLTESTAV